jgi:hypothetical protein
MNADDVKRWARGHEAAAARERLEMQRHPLTPDQAFASALSLLAFDESSNGSPFGRRDPVTLREDAEMREAWAKLRARWTRGR